MGTVRIRIKIISIFQVFVKPNEIVIVIVIFQEKLCRNWIRHRMTQNSNRNHRIGPAGTLPVLLYSRGPESAMRIHASTGIPRAAHGAQRACRRRVCRVCVSSLAESMCVTVARRTDRIQNLERTHPRRSVPGRAYPHSTPRLNAHNAPRNSLSLEHSALARSLLCSHCEHRVTVPRPPVS